MEKYYKISIHTTKIWMKFVKRSKFWQNKHCLRSLRTFCFLGRVSKTWKKHQKQLSFIRLPTQYLWREFWSSWKPSTNQYKKMLKERHIKSRKVSRQPSEVFLFRSSKIFLATNRTIPPKDSTRTRSELFWIEAASFDEQKNEWWWKKFQPKGFQRIRSIIFNKLVAIERFRLRVKNNEKIIDLDSYTLQIRWMTRRVKPLKRTKKVYTACRVSPSERIT